MIEVSLFLVILIWYRQRHSMINKITVIDISHFLVILIQYRQRHMINKITVIDISHFLVIYGTDRDI